MKDDEEADDEKGAEERKGGADLSFSKVSDESAKKLRSSLHGS
jgi:hypothetical protein